MFETDAYESHLHRPTQPLRPVYHYEPAAGVAEMSMLIWGEHCIECAAPSCFQTCDLYQKRPDQRCRRFSYGIYRNRRFASPRNFGAEVSFKKWGKLESRGNTFLMPRERLLTLEHLLYLSRPFSNVLGASINALTRDIRWSYVTHSLRERLVRWLHRRGANARQPEAFLLEIYNPGPDVARLQLVISPVKSETGGRGPTPPTAPFRARLDLPVGYSRHQFSRTQFAKVTERPFDIALIPDAETTPTLVFLTADFVALDPQRKDQQRSPVKCIVWDLDNTLWDGVLLETDNVRLREEFIAVIQQLDQRGLLHSIASKNDHKHAWQKLTELGIADYFLYPQINWSPKGEHQDNCHQFQSRSRHLCVRR
jgi:HAD superfamily phosphatase (TIGR01681 family)